MQNHQTKYNYRYCIFNGCPIFRRFLRKNTFGSYSDWNFIGKFKIDVISWLWRHIYATPSEFLTILAYLEL